MVDGDQLLRAFVQSLRWIVAGLTGGGVVYFATTPGARSLSGIATVGMVLVGTGLEYFALNLDPEYDDEGEPDG